MKKYYAILNSNKVIKCYDNEHQAVKYLLTCWFDYGLEDVKLKVITQGYFNYLKNLVDKTDNF